MDMGLADRTVPVTVAGAGAGRRTAAAVPAADGRTTGEILRVSGGNR